MVSEVIGITIIGIYTTAIILILGIMVSRIKR